MPQMFGNLSIRSRLLALSAEAAGRAVAAVHELQEERVRAAVAGLELTGDPALDQAMAVATELLDRLAMVRVESDRRAVTPERAGHHAMVDALLGVTRGLAASLQAPAATSSARLLLAVAAAKEAAGQERVVLAGVPAEAAGGAGAAPTG
jgi:Nitrate and nitrite sensing